ncbi:hypothetical protein A3194_08465 [Candidatus Thiodiazotropha endoloripes]|uniref:hypothetical protein n=1 Tax=Candidatus Thiodiazotropha endoloripes TaxID=1818881 RepID=UPI00083E0AA7|nr:hypothetical protein [Candidatus Thiodiazotropha endoloripes]MCG7903757.1 hypothetical protein [Candidatus Thiodiazotropha weberae]MCG7912739.1 hypothetical protein [Candidatus Thiodiazotropha weberae]ODB92408.1 hypothetical protein A3194_08465 [Candidatus Thiodiazotropha endoloripes]
MSKPIIILWTVLSFVVSGIFVFYGLMLLQVEQLPPLSIIAATVALSYGLATIYLLSQAWTKTDTNLIQITKYIVVAMFIAQVVLNLDVGMISSFEWLGLLVLSLMIGINWFSIKSVTEYHNQA